MESEELRRPKSAFRSCGVVCVSGDKSPSITLTLLEVDGIYFLLSDDNLVWWHCAKSSV